MPGLADDISDPQLSPTTPRQQDESGAAFEPQTGAKQVAPTRELPHSTSSVPAGAAKLSAASLNAGASEVTARRSEPGAVTAASRAASGAASPIGTQVRSGPHLVQCHHRHTKLSHKALAANTLLTLSDTALPERKLCSAATLVAYSTPHHPATCGSHTHPLIPPNAGHGTAYDHRRRAGQGREPFFGME